MKEEIEKLKDKIVSFVTEAIKRANLLKEDYVVSILNIGDYIEWAYYKSPMSSYSLRGVISFVELPSDSDWDSKLSKFAADLVVKYGEIHSRHKKLDILRKQIAESAAGQELAAMGYIVSLIDNTYSANIR